MAAGVYTSKYLSPPIGKKFGRWTVTGYARVLRDPSNKPVHYWNCACDCGTSREVKAATLHFGQSVSCGCYQPEAVRRAALTHGASSSDEYGIWKAMRRRCSSPKGKGYHNYGGRGIRVCERWRRSFENFIADMGPRPSDEHSIDRINNDGNYEPSNCRWATRHEQMRNTSVNRFLTFRGQRKRIEEWSVDVGIDVATISSRLCRGWSDTDALSRPVSDQHNIKITEQEARQIIHDYHEQGGKRGTLAMLGRRFGITGNQVGHIVHGKQWPHLERPEIVDNLKMLAGK